MSYPLDLSHSLDMFPAVHSLNVEPSDSSHARKRSNENSTEALHATSLAGLVQTRSGHQHSEPHWNATDSSLQRKRPAPAPAATLEQRPRKAAKESHAETLPAVTALTSFVEVTSTSSEQTACEGSVGGLAVAVTSQACAVEGDGSVFESREQEEVEEEIGSSPSSFLFCCGGAKSPTKSTALTKAAPKLLRAGSSPAKLSSPSTFTSPMLNETLSCSLSSSSLLFPVSPTTMRTFSDNPTVSAAVTPIRNSFDSATQRLKVIEEIKNTEQTYVDALSDLTTHFMEPISKSASKLGITHKQISDMFSNIAEIAQFHVVFLSDLCKPESRIGEVFLHLSDFLKMYTHYLNGYDAIITTINTLRANRNFQKLLEEKRQLLAGRGLMMLLIMPVQRIPRYVLLLRELNRYTPNDHPEWVQLNNALSKIQSIATHVNESKRQVENMTRLLDIQSRLRNNSTFELFRPDRRLLREGTLQRVMESYVMSGASTLRRLNNNDVVEQRVFVFTDLLLWTSSAFHIAGYVKLTEMQFLPTELFQIPCTIWLAHKGKPFSADMIFRCKNADEHKEWMHFLEAAMYKANELSRAGAETGANANILCSQLQMEDNPMSPQRSCTHQPTSAHSALNYHAQSHSPLVSIVRSYSSPAAMQLPSPGGRRLELEF